MPIQVLKPRRKRTNFKIRIFEYELCFIVFLLLVSPAVVFSYQDRTLLPEKFTSGYYGGPSFSVTNFADEVGLFVGGKGGWVINRKFVVGGSAGLLINSVDLRLRVPADSGDAQLDTALAANLYYGGLELGYIESPGNLFHYSMWLQIGIGLIGYRDYECGTCGKKSDLDNDIFFIAEPRMDLNLNLAKMVRLSLGMGWRYAYDLELRGISNQDFQGPIGILAVRVGRY